MANKLSEMIDRIVNERVEAAMAELMGSMDEATDNGEPTADVVAPAPRKRQTPRRFATKVAYAAVPVRANAAAGTKLARTKTIKALTPALAEVWAIVSKTGPVTAADVNAALKDRTNKSIQSALFGLRRVGLIESQPLAE